MESPEIHALAHLARLTIDDDIVDTVSERLTRVMSLIDQLKSVDTDGIEPMSHPLDRVQTLRADKVTESNERHRWQSVAPSTEDGLYLVPKVID